MRPDIDGRLAERVREIASLIADDAVQSGPDGGKITTTAEEQRRILNVAADVLEEYVMAAQWQPIETAPLGEYVLLGFDGPFSDMECPGVAVGKLQQNGAWLTAIWAASSADWLPVRWMRLRPIDAGRSEVGDG